MNKKTGLAAIAIITVLTSGTTLAMSNSWWNEYKPYVGADAQVRRMDFKGGYGDNLYQHHSPQGNIYAGLKFSEWVGVEVGYESTTTRTRPSTLTTGDMAAGMVVPAASSPVIFKSKMKIKGPHIDLVGFYYFGEHVPVQLLGSIGAGRVKGTSERQTLSAGGTPMSTVRTLSTHKTVLRLMGGLQYMWNCNLGARATVGLVKTSKMVIFARDNLSTVAPEVKPKDSTVYGLGLFWIF